MQRLVFSVARKVSDDETASKKLTIKVHQPLGEISGSHGGEYEDGVCAV
jgi:hypothetical protein